MDTSLAADLEAHCEACDALSYRLRSHAGKNVELATHIEVIAYHVANIRKQLSIEGSQCCGGMKRAPKRSPTQLSVCESAIVLVDSDGEESVVKHKAPKKLTRTNTSSPSGGSFFQTYWAGDFVSSRERSSKILGGSGHSHRDVTKKNENERTEETSEFDDTRRGNLVCFLNRIRDYATCDYALLPEQLHYWDIGIGLLIATDVCFYDTFKATYKYTPMTCLEVLIDAVFWVDIFLMSQTAYISSGYRLVTGRKEVFRHYLNTWFWIDLAANIPWDYVARRVSGDTVYEPILQLLALFGVSRVLRAPRIIRRVTADWNLHSVKKGFIMYMIFTLLIAHLLACLFYLCPVVFNPNASHTWRTEHNIDSYTPIGRYIRSLYWAVTTMTTLGYGDIVPIQSSEICLVMIAEMLGASSFALLVMHIQKLYDVVVQDTGVSIKQRNELMMYLDQMKVCKPLKSKIMGYLSYEANMHTYSSFDDDDPRFSRLNDALRLELRVEVFAPILRRSLVFRNASERLTSVMAESMRSRSCSPGETVVHPGSYREQAYLVLTGAINIFYSAPQYPAKSVADANSARMHSSDSNNVIGIVALLDDDTYATLESMTKSIHAIADDHCSLAFITRHDFRQRVLPVLPDADKTLLDEMARLCGVADGTDTTVLIGNVPAGMCTTAWLEETFHEYGKIAAISCRIKPPAEDGRHMSSALVTFRDYKDAALVAALGFLRIIYDGTNADLSLKLHEKNPNKARALAILSRERRLGCANFRAPSNTSSSLHFECERGAPRGRFTASLPSITPASKTRHPRIRR